MLSSGICHLRLLFVMVIAREVTVGPESVRMNEKVSALSSFQMIDFKFGNKGELVGGWQRERTTERSTGRAGSWTHRCSTRRARPRSTSHSAILSGLLSFDTGCGHVAVSAVKVRSEAKGRSNGVSPSSRDHRTLVAT